MGERRIPKRVRVNGKWYDVALGWAGRLDLSEWMSHPQYTASEPYFHMDNLFFVYDTNGSKVGEFHTTNRSYSGCVEDFEM